MHLINRDTVHPLRSGEPLLTQPIKDSAALSDSSIRWGGLRFGGNILIMYVLILLMLPVVGSAETEVEGEVSGEWTAEGSPYIVVDSTWVPEEESLTLLEGVIVMFEENQGLYVYGSLDATGNEEDSVYIRVNEDVEHWRGLRFYGRNRTEWNYASIICPDIAFVFDLGCSLTMNHCLVDVDRMTAKENDSSVENCNLTFSQSSISVRYIFGTTGGILSASHTRFDFGDVDDDRPGFYSTGTGYILTSCEVIGELHPSFGYSIADSCRFLRLPNGEPTGVAIIGPQGRIRNCYVEGSVGIGESYGQLIRCENNVILGGLGFSMCNIEILDCEVMGVMRTRQCELVVMRNSILSRQFRISHVESMIIDNCYFVNGEPGPVGFSDHGGDNPQRTITRSVFFTKINLGYLYVATEGLFDHNTVFFDSVGFFAIETSRRIVFTNNIIMSVIPGHNLFGQSTSPVFEYNCVYGFEYFNGFEPDLIPIEDIDSTNIIANPLIEWDGVIPNLSINSGCIDRGDPEFDLDPDNTRTDIGACFFDQRHFAPGLDVFISGGSHLDDVYPNPFNRIVTFSFSMTQPGVVNINLYNLLGKHLEEVISGSFPVGSHTFIWSGDRFPCGNYVILMTTNGQVSTRMVTIIK